MPTVTFEQWVEAVFAHPIRKPEWYWHNDFDEYWDALGLSDALTVAYMTRLFSDADQLKRYSWGQVAQAIWFLIGESSPGRSASALLNSEVVLEPRVDCVPGMAEFSRR